MLKELDIMRADALTILSDQVMKLMMEVQELESKIDLDYHAVTKWGSHMIIAPRP
jgi:hypothetical protein